MLACKILVVHNIRKNEVGMIKRSKSVLGIDLGSRYIKYVELQPRGKNPVVKSFGTVETPSGVIDQTGILDPAAVSQVLTPTTGK